MTGAVFESNGAAARRLQDNIGARDLNLFLVCSGSDGDGISGRATRERGKSLGDGGIST